MLSAIDKISMVIHSPRSSLQLKSLQEKYVNYSQLKSPPFTPAPLPILHFVALIVEILRQHFFVQQPVCHLRSTAIRRRRQRVFIGVEGARAGSMLQQNICGGTVCIAGAEARIV